jgi:hypothetical protein
MEAAMKRPLRKGWVHLATITVTVFLWAIILSAPHIYVAIRDALLR